MDHYAVLHHFTQFINNELQCGGSYHLLVVIITGADFAFLIISNHFEIISGIVLESFGIQTCIRFTRWQQLNGTRYAERLSNRVLL